MSMLQMKIKYNFRLKETLYIQSEGGFNLDNGGWRIPLEGRLVWIRWVCVHGCQVLVLLPEGRLH